LILFGPLHLGQHGLGHLGVPVQVIVEMLREKVAHEGADGLAPRFHVRGPQFRFRLGFEYGFDDAHADGRHDPLSHVRSLEISLRVIPDHLDDRFPERTQMGSPLRGVLPVDEAVVVFSVLFAMGEGDLDVVTDEMHDGIHRLLGQVLLQEITQPVLGANLLAVEGERQPLVQVGVISQHSLHDLRVIGILPEKVGIRLIAQLGPRRLATRLRRFHLLDDHASHIVHRPGFAVPVGLYVKSGRERIDRFDADPVQADRLLERLGIVLRARVDLGGAFHQLAEGNPPAVVPHPDGRSAQLHLDRPAVPHDVFVDRVVDHLLEQHVDPIVRRTAVSQLADIHPRSQPDVLPPVQRSNVFFGVVDRHNC